ncbi:cupredoxin domain-containing protein [Fulvivirga lutea]|uniref:Cupredoxin domain-containing protein n=1 Tax=Fulvivirga lutea TaxID=2810512 RepID=A0A975A137_9BACT|nr:cupredoxin domain-containing protein [Fulvivirga lutea]QSE97466.1 cupredoxin domain-containing protein [Fulvivirga lutea]
MENLLKSILFAAVLSISSIAQAQTPERVKLSQTAGEFTQTELTLEAGKQYIFEVTNEGVDHELGFVIAPKGKTDQKNHIPEAYLKKTINDGETAESKTVTLEKGEYVYFCPLNPTPQYSIMVK